MSAQDDARPIIIKRKKKGGGDGHHGGAWKVAYADFVTAMMAFFMLMWLLNATTESQRKGIADYFAPTIAINRISGGGDGSFGGDSVFSENTMPKNGTGAASASPTESRKARGETGQTETGDASDSADELFETIEAELLGKGGESKVMENALEHIITEVTDEGMVIQIVSLEDAPLFQGRSAEHMPVLQNIAYLIVETVKVVANDIAVNGHVAALPVVRAEDDGWDLSAARATRMRELLENAGISAQRMRRVTGFSDREPWGADPMAVANDRLEIILLRE